MAKTKTRHAAARRRAAPLVDERVQHERALKAAKRRERNISRLVGELARAIGVNNRKLETFARVVLDGLRGEVAPATLDRPVNS